MNVKLNIKNQNIIDIFITALEGGSNYWYYLADDSIKAIREKVPHNENPFLAESFGQAVLKGAEVPVYDFEDESELLGTVTKESLAKGLQKATDDGREEISMLLEDEICDDGEADVLFQYFVLGEITFG